MGTLLAPPPPPSFAETPELKITGEKRTILGRECVRGVIRESAGQIEIWAIPDATLFPFRLLHRFPGPHRHAPRGIEGQWPELVRAAGLFPLEVTWREEKIPAGTLRQENDRDPAGRTLFKVVALEAKKIEDEARFAVPDGYVAIELSPF